MKDKKDGILEAYLKIASEEFLEQVEEENKLLMTKYEEYKYPSELDAWFDTEMRKKRKKDRRSTFKRNMLTLSKRTAAIFIVVIAMGSVLVLSVDAIRVEFLNLFITETDTYKELEFDNSESNQELLTIAKENKLVYYPKVIPEGFKLESFEVSDLVSKYVFSKGEEIIFFDIYKGESDIRFDNQEGEMSDIIIKEMRGKISRSDGRITVVFKVDSYIIDVFSNTDEEIIIEMLENTF